MPGNQRRRYIEKLLDVLDNNAISVGELLQIAQYDLTTKRPHGSLASAVKRVANVLGFRNKDKLRNETSSTYLFSVATYYILRKLLKQHNLVFAIEPRILSSDRYTVTYDYAIINLSRRKIIVLVEVKRLQRLGNVHEHFSTFREKVSIITHLMKSNNIKHVALHLHVTTDLCSECGGVERLLASIGLLLSETRQPISIISTDTCYRGDSTSGFQNQLFSQISTIIT